MSNNKEKENISVEGQIKDSNMSDINFTEDSMNRGKSKIEVREKKGLLRSAIPQISLPIAWIVLFFNVFVPGSGTLILSLFALCGVSTDLKKPSRCFAFFINFFTAIFQVITAVVIVGWIWSVYWGMYAVTEANERKEDKKTKKQQEMIKSIQEIESGENIDGKAQTDSDSADKNFVVENPV